MFSWQTKRKKADSDSYSILMLHSSAIKSTIINTCYLLMRNLSLHLVQSDMVLQQFTQ